MAFLWTAAKQQNGWKERQIRVTEKSVTLPCFVCLKTGKQANFARCNLPISHKQSFDILRARAKTGANIMRD
jgi:hypothetical protein